MINSIYRFLRPEDGNSVQMIGSHWQNIGFQSNDPRTDIRGTGMLGVLQILWFAENYPNTLKAIYAHSLTKDYEFPLAIKLFEFSALVLSQLKTKKIFYACNEHSSVFLACNKVYACLVIDYMKGYIQQKLTLLKMDSLNKQQKANLLK